MLGSPNGCTVTYLQPRDFLIEVMRKHSKLDAALLLGYLRNYESARFSLDLPDLQRSKRLEQVILTPKPLTPTLNPQPPTPAHKPEPKL